MKKNYKIILLFLIVFFTFFLLFFQQKSKDNFSYTIKALIDKNKDQPEIVESLVLLENAYDTDNIYIDFEDYPMAVYGGSLQNINLTTAPSHVNRFRTILQEDLQVQAINFAGKYTLIEIPLTAYPGNYVMIDRETGESYTVPFEILNKEIRPDSALIKVNPKEYFTASCLSSENETGCVSFAELSMRPYWYIWDGEQFIALKNSAPLTNFWNM